MFMKRMHMVDCTRNITGWLQSQQSSRQGDMVACRSMSKTRTSRVSWRVGSSEHIMELVIAIWCCGLLEYSVHMTCVRELMIVLLWMVGCACQLRTSLIC